MGPAYTVTSLEKTHGLIYTKERLKPVLQRHIKAFWDANTCQYFFAEKLLCGHK